MVRIYHHWNNAREKIAYYLSQKVEGITQAQALPENKQKVLDFLKYLEVDEAIHPERVIKAKYEYAVVLFPLMSYAKAPFLELSAEDILTYFREKEATVYRSETTLRTIKAKVKRFFKWLNGGDEYPANVKHLKKKKAKTKTYTQANKPKFTRWYPSDVKALIKATADPQEKAFIAVLYDSGCRIAEMMNMRIGDLPKGWEHEDGISFIVRNDTGERTAYLDETIADLRRWMDLHPKKDDPAAPVWINTRTLKVLTVEGINQKIKAVKKHAGIKKYWKAHLFRKSRNSELTELGVPPEIRNRRFGWHDGSNVGSVVYFDTDDDTILGATHKRKKTRREEFEAKTCPKCHNTMPQDSIICPTCAMGQVELLLKALEDPAKRRKIAEIMAT